MSCLLDKATVCARLGCSPGTLWSMIGRGEFPPATKIGGSLRWSDETVDEWIRDRVANGPKQVVKGMVPEGAPTDANAGARKKRGGRRAIEVRS
jgi:predicted DNA-binding transcriptional regulator AlpA